MSVGASRAMARLAHPVLLQPARIPSAQKAHPAALLGLEAHPGLQTLCWPGALLAALPLLLPVHPAPNERRYRQAGADCLKMRHSLPLHQQKGASLSLPLTVFADPLRPHLLQQDIYRGLRLRLLKWRLIRPPVECLLGMPTASPAWSMWGDAGATLAQIHALREPIQPVLPLFAPRAIGYSLLSGSEVGERALPPLRTPQPPLLPRCKKAYCTKQCSI